MNSRRRRDQNIGKSGVQAVRLCGIINFRGRQGYGYVYRKYAIGKFTNEAIQPCLQLHSLGRPASASQLQYPSLDLRNGDRRHIETSCKAFSRNEFGNVRGNDGTVRRKN